MRGNIVVVVFSDFESRRRFVIGFFHLRIFWLPLVVVVVYLLSVEALRLSDYMNAPPISTSSKPNLMACVPYSF